MWKMIVTNVPAEIKDALLKGWEPFGISTREIQMAQVILFSEGPRPNGNTEIEVTIGFRKWIEKEQNK